MASLIHTPTKKVICGAQAPLLEMKLRERQQKKNKNRCIIWGAVNLCVVIFLRELIYTCSIYTSNMWYFLYGCFIIFIFNFLYYLGSYICITVFSKKNSAVFVQNNIRGPESQMTPNITFSNLIAPNTPANVTSSTPMNMSSRSWMSNTPPNESSHSPTTLAYRRTSPQTPTISPVLSLRRDTSGIDFITDEQSLGTYLKDFEINEKLANLSNPIEQPSNALSTFWSYPMAKTAKDVSAFFKRSQYQLSSPNNSAVSNSPKSDDKSSPAGYSKGMETWKRLNVNSVALTQWNANLRMWISQTVLDRLIKEFANIDDALQKQGLLDIQIGKVGLERLRRSAQTAQVLQFIPTLPLMLPFLELTSNQEYLVKRIRELAKGGCISDFKWNSGSGHNGKEWDPSLPTDSAIIMHLFASYLDTQLMPLPSQPDVKPFTGYHYIKANAKMRTSTPNTLAIQQVTEYPPHHRVIIGEELFELVKGYNNLFHSILLFLYYVNKKEDGMLGRVNLGRSGVNMLWVIQM